MLRFIHNRNVVKYFLTFVGIGIAFYFAWNFYPFGEWSGKQFLSDVPSGPQILGIVCAVIMGSLVLLLLFYKEYIKEDTQAYSDKKGDQSFKHAFDYFTYLVVGLEAFSVAFRTWLLNGSKVGFILLGIGLLGMGLTYVIGKVLHALVNRPYEIEADRMMNDAGNAVLDRGRQGWRKLSIDELRHVKSGNFNPLNRIQDMKDARKRRKELREQEEHQKWLDRDKKGQQAAETFMQPRDPVELMPPPGSNNHTRSFN